MPMSKKHRGRIQAQGKNLEESVTWAQDEPLSKKDGLTLLELLKSKLSGKEQKAREKQFAQAKRFIENVQNGEDAPSDTSFLNRKTKHERIDIEVWSGTAFGIFLLLFIIWYLMG
jgi:thiamine kinase-like enzyme